VALHASSKPEKTFADAEGLQVLMKKMNLSQDNRRKSYSFQKIARRIMLRLIQPTEGNNQ
jgi:hypothetical protein